MKQTLKLLLLLTLASSTNCFANWLHPNECAPLPKECKKEDQPIYCQVAIKGAKMCVANNFNDETPFFKGAAKLGLTKPPLYFPESALTNDSMELHLPHDINIHSPLGQKAAPIQYIGTSFRIQVRDKYTVEQCIGDIDSTISIIKFYKNQYDIAVSKNEYRTNYQTEILALSQNMNALANIGQALIELSDNYLTYSAGPYGPKDRSEKLLKAAGKDHFKKEVAEELIANDYQQLESIKVLQQKAESLKEFTEVARQNFNYLYETSRENVALEQQNHIEQMPIREAKPKEKHSNQQSPIPTQEIYPEGTWKLPEGSVVCATQDLYSTQLKLVIAGEKNLLDGCGISKKNYKVIILDHNTFSASKIMIIENKITIWTDATFLKAGTGKP